MRGFPVILRCCPDVGDVDLLLGELLEVMRALHVDGLEELPLALKDWLESSVQQGDNIARTFKGVVVLDEGRQTAEKAILVH